MAETDLHRILMIDLIDSVERWFRNDPEFYVSGNLFVYYQEGDPAKVVAPDFFVTRGVRKGLRRVYKLWEEKKAPDLVLELTSPSTRLEDLGNRRVLYEELGVQEYFIFDPEGRLEPALRGFRLREGTFEPLAPTRQEEGKLVFTSEVLGLELHGQGDSLRLFDPGTGGFLPTSKDLQTLVDSEKKRAEAEKSRAEAEKRRADEAEAEISRLREELSRRGGGPRR